MQFSALFWLATPYRAKLIFVAAVLLFGSIAGLGVPWLAAQLLGTLFEDKPDSIGAIVVLLVLSISILTGLNIAGARASSDLSNRIQKDVRRDIYAHIQRLPVSFHDNSRQGDLLALMTWEAAQFGYLLSNIIASVPSSFVTVIGALAILFWLHPMAAISIPILVPGYFLILKIVGRHLRALAQRAQEAEAEVFVAAEEDLEMLSTIKASAAESLRLSLYEMRLEKARALNQREGRIAAALGPLIGLFTSLAFIIIVMALGNSISAQNTSASEVLGILFYVALLARPIGSLVDLYGRFQGARGTLKRMQDVFKESIEEGYSATKKLKDCRGDIAFESVYFSYPDKREILRDVNLQLQAGEIVAVVGQNGAGKSTIGKLLVRFYDTNAGNILIDGLNIKDIDINFLRRNIGYVPQQTFLFNNTVLNNITFGEEKYERDRLEEVLHLSRASDLRNQLPSGLDTVVGDHGVRLSGGQRQRIALARALLRNPRIIILDEATSMYDPDCEADFVKESKAAFAHRTVIIITHRPASLSIADRVFKVADGQVIEVKGTTEHDAMRH